MMDRKQLLLDTMAETVRRMPRACRENLAYHRERRTPILNGLGHKTCDGRGGA